MRRQTRLMLAWALAAGILIAGLSRAAGAQGSDLSGLGIALGSAFTYQGHLNDGGSAANGLYDFRFRCYDAASGGSQVGSTANLDDVTVLDGLVNAQLDFGGGVFQGAARWLEVGVRAGESSGAYTTLSPRQALTPAPYALYAARAPWSGLSGVPAALADGDDDTTYSAGTGLALSGTTFSADTGYLQRRVGASCSAGQAIRAVGDDGTVTCQSMSGGASWSLTGNSGTTPGTQFLGTTDNVALELRVNGARALRLEPRSSPNLVGGYGGNSVTAGVVGATIGGGGASGAAHRVSDDFGTVGGGWGNQAGNGAGTTTDRRFATVGGGYTNTASGIAATVAGGERNTASGSAATVAGGVGSAASADDATVGGGYTNTAGGKAATVAGGYRNTASGIAATVAGGQDNTASADEATVGGGYANTASGVEATVGGGRENRASADRGTVAGGGLNTAVAHATVGGGYINTASGIAATVGGGERNTASSRWATVGGGERNTTSGSAATVGGGQGNTASGDWATVGGGTNNTASGGAATVGGGQGNTASSGWATVAGGYRNTAVGTASFAAGWRAKANHEGTFVWADRTDADFTSTGANQFLIRASGGVGIGTSSPTHILHVAGVARSTQSTWATSSDGRVKTNVRPLAGSLETILQLNPVSFEYIEAYKGDNPALDGRQVGFIAQEVAAVDPSMVTTVRETFGDTTIDDFEVLDSSNLVPMLVRAVQELAAERDAQQAVIADLQQQTGDLEARLAALESRPSVAAPMPRWPALGLLAGGLMAAVVWIGRKGIFAWMPGGGR